MRKLTVLLILILICFLWPTTSFAGTGVSSGSFALADDFMADAPSKFSKKPSLKTDISYLPQSDFSDGMGAVSVVSTRIKASYSIFELSYGLSHFIWKNEGDIKLQEGNDGGTRAPFENLQDFTLEAHMLNGRFYKDWLYWLDCTATAAFEKYFPGAMGVGLQGGLAYDLWHGLVLGGGAKAVAVSPINDDLFGNVEFGLVLSVSHEAFVKGLELMGVDMSEKDSDKTFGLTLVISSSEKIYSSDGYIKEASSTLGAFLDYSPNKTWTFSIGPEYVYDRWYTFYSSSGRKVSKNRLEDSFGGFARVVWNF